MRFAQRGTAACTPVSASWDNSLGCKTMQNPLPPAQGPGELYLLKLLSPRPHLQSVAPPIYVGFDREGFVRTLQAPFASRPASSRPEQCLERRAARAACRASVSQAVFELADIDAKTAGTLAAVLRPVLSVGILLMIVRIVLSWYPQVSAPLYCAWQLISCKAQPWQAS